MSHVASSFITDDDDRCSPVLPHCVWVLAASVGGHNNRVRWAHPLQSVLRGEPPGGRWGALLSTADADAAFTSDSQSCLFITDFRLLLFVFFLSKTFLIISFYNLISTTMTPVLLLLLLWLTTTMINNIKNTLCIFVRKLIIKSIYC